MGNNRFKLSDIIPNAWFYKLMEIGTKPTSTPRSNSKFSKKKLPKATSTSPRHSYYYSSHSVSNTHKILISPLTSKSSNTHFPDPSRKSKTSSKSKSTNASTSIDCSCRFTSSETDIVIDVKSQSCFDHKLQTFNHGLESIPKFDLPPILTRPPKSSALKPGAAEPATKSRHEFEERTSRGSVSVKVAMQETGGGRRSGSQGFRVRSSSPRLVSRKIQACNRRKSAVPDGFAVVKSSLDPQRDFRDSMVEMIVENNIWSSKDLEHLLACYLSLNSNQYHDLIVKVFEQIWFDLTGIRKLRSEFDS